MSKTKNPNALRRLVKRKKCEFWRLERRFKGRNAVYRQFNSVLDNYGVRWTISWRGSPRSRATASRAGSSRMCLPGDSASVGNVRTVNTYYHSTACTYSQRCVENFLCSVVSTSIGDVLFLNVQCNLITFDL